MFLPLFDRYRTVKLLILLCFNCKNYSSRVAAFFTFLFHQSSKPTYLLDWWNNFYVINNLQSYYISLQCPLLPKPLPVVVLSPAAK